MSLDQIQFRQGLVQITPTPAVTVAASLTTVASNQYPGGVAFGGQAGFAEGKVSNAGGALYLQPYPGGTVVSTMGTGGTLSHQNAPVLAFSASATANNLQLQPPSYPGQLLILDNRGATSCSVVTGGTVTLPGGTTSTAVQVLDTAFSVAANGKYILFASPHAASTTGQWPVALWSRLV